ncbi:MAG: hypothetical protein WB999_05660, partial [Candidatus Binataceae bacterium]
LCPATGIARSKLNPVINVTVKRMRFLLQNHVCLPKAARRKAKLSECSRSAADQSKHYAVV